MKTAIKSSFKHPHPYTFEKTREAVVTIKNLRPMLTSSELETLAILLDADAMETIEQSVEEAAASQLEPLEEAIK